jgi:hypothetical protein
MDRLSGQPRSIWAFGPEAPHSILRTAIARAELRHPKATDGSVPVPQDAHDPFMSGRIALAKPLRNARTGEVANQSPDHDSARNLINSG